MDHTQELKREVVDLGVRVMNAGLTRGTCGNISCRIPGRNKILITPSGVPYGEITPLDILIVDFQGQSDGARSPSMETALHMAIYKKRDDVGAILHTHSLHALAVSSVIREIPVFLDEIFSHIGGSLRVTDYAVPGGTELAHNVVATLGERDAVLLSNHGAVCCGKNLQDAYETATAVETICQIYILSSSLGDILVLPEDGKGYQQAMFKMKKSSCHP